MEREREGVFAPVELADYRCQCIAMFIERAKDRLRASRTEEGQRTSLSKERKQIAPDRLKAMRHAFNSIGNSQWSKKWIWILPVQVVLVC